MTIKTLRKQLADAHHELRDLKNARESVEDPLRIRIASLERELAGARQTMDALRAECRVIQAFAATIVTRASDAAGHLASGKVKMPDQVWRDGEWRSVL